METSTAKGGGAATKANGDGSVTDREIDAEVVVSMGDPVGISPEVLLLALWEHAPPPGVNLRIFGDIAALEQAALRLGRPLSLPPTVSIVEITRLDAAAIEPGQASAATGRAQIAYLEAAVAEATSKRAHAIVTAPMSKAAVHRAGFAFAGHTEYLQQAFGVSQVVMLLAGRQIRVAVVTRHIALAEVPSRLSVKDIATTTTMTAAGLKADFGVAKPRLAVCGLNPHAGEWGAFGDEELRLVAPAIEEARQALEGSGAEITGPCVPDAVFREAAAGRYDAVVALYHDQGLIPVKLIDFDSAVNVTLGLPVARTSPDHGVAYDLAGKGLANASSMAEALRLGCEMALRRRSGQVGQVVGSTVSGAQKLR